MRFSKRFLKKFLEHKTRSNTYFHPNRTRNVQSIVTPAFTSVNGKKLWRQCLLCKELRACATPEQGKHRKIESPSSQLLRHQPCEPHCLVPNSSQRRADQPKVITVEFSSSGKTAPSAENQVSIGSLMVQTSFSGRGGISSAHIFVQQCVVSGPVTVATMVSLALTTSGPGVRERRFLVVVIVFVVVVGVRQGSCWG